MMRAGGGFRIAWAAAGTLPLRDLAHLMTIHPHTRAAGLMLAGTLAFAFMAISIRFASQTLPTFEVVFFRSFFGLLALLPWLLRAERSWQRTSQLPRYIVRCAIGLAAMIAGFWAIGNLPLAQAIALSYSAPVFVTLFAVLFLREQVRARRWIAVTLGFIGVLVVVRPGSAEFSAGTLIALLAAMLIALAAIQIKQLSRTDAPDTIVLYTYLFWVPMSLIPALAVWVWPQGIAWLWVICSGVFGTAGQLLWTRALNLGEVSALTPISFMQLPVVAVAGWLWFEEGLDVWTWIGAGIILAANVYIAHRESRQARKRDAAPVAAEVKPIE